MRDLPDDLLEILKSKLQAGGRGYRGVIEVDHIPDLETGVIVTTEYRCSTIDLDKSLRMTADEAVVTFPWREEYGWGIDAVFKTNTRCRIYQWFGDEANRTKTFTGILDRPHCERDYPMVSLKLRDMIALAIDQSVVIASPQESGETGAVRTPANGVYLNREVSDIVDDILDRVGWPTADRLIVPTSFVVEEYLLEDGWTYAEAIVGDDRLGGLVGYEAYADEDGVFHFEPALATSSVTDPPTADYIFRTGEDITSLEEEVDQDDLRTRVRVRGPLTTQVLTDEWREIWRTSKIHDPVGIWFDPTNSANIRVLDHTTKKLYKLRQSDRKILSSVDISTIIAHPLGLSGDPADSSVYWILNAPWIDGGSGGNRAKKVRKSDNHVLASFALPDGQISAIKVSASYLYFTRLDTDRFYRCSKATGAAVASYRHTYNSVLQSNPSGLMIDGTTLYLFWANGGTTARFLVCAESAPGTVTDVVKTAGTTLHGGEMDTLTHTHCYGDSDTLGLVAKFSLLASEDRTTQVFAEVVDTDLEDELGMLAQVEDREHDTHPGDADHPYEIRRDTLSIPIVLSIAQATETATRRLELRSTRRDVVNAGVVGNPGLQKTDVIGIVDPVTSRNSLYSLDTYRVSMGADTSYLGVVALVLIPDLTAEAGDIDDEGEGTDDGSGDVTIVDLNLLFGTDTDGGSFDASGNDLTFGGSGSEAYPPSRANDADFLATETISSAAVYSSPGPITRRLKADLGAPFAVSTMTCWSDNFVGHDPGLTLEYSSDGVSWSPVTGYTYVNTNPIGEINKQEIGFDEVTAQWWRIESTFNVGPGIGFITYMRVWSWQIWGVAP